MLHEHCDALMIRFPGRVYVEGGGEEVSIGLKEKHLSLHGQVIHLVIAFIKWRHSSSFQILYIDPGQRKRPHPEEHLSQIPRRLPVQQEHREFPIGSQLFPFYSRFHFPAAFPGKHDAAEAPADDAGP